MCIRLKLVVRICELEVNENERKLIFSRRFSILLNFSIGKNSAQTDEEKQRERQRNEREIKHAELEAQHLKVIGSNFHPYHNEFHVEHFCDVFFVLAFVYVRKSSFVYDNRKSVKHVKPAY